MGRKSKETLEAEALAAEALEDARKAAAAVEEIAKDAPAAAEKPEEAREEQETFSRREVQAMIAEALAEAQRSAPAPQVVQVSADTPMVTVLFQSEVSRENMIQFGPNGRYGSVTGPYGVFAVPKSAFGADFRDGMVQGLLDTRELIVLDGLTDEERERYGVQYGDGEWMDADTFRKMLDLGERLPEVYRKLCPKYREMVASRVALGYEQKDKRVYRSLVTALNAASRDVDGGKGYFQGIIEKMNAEDAR